MWETQFSIFFGSSDSHGRNRLSLDLFQEFGVGKRTTAQHISASYATPDRTPLFRVTQVHNNRNGTCEYTFQRKPGLYIIDTISI